MEIWKDIKGCEGMYQVSNLGNVRSLDREVFNKGTGKSYLIKGIQLKPFLHNKTGYLRVGLKRKTPGVHRLVCQAFHGLDYDNKNLFACHKNDIKTDNRADNLWIGTNSDNIQDALRKGTKFGQRGELNGKVKTTTKLTTEKVIKIKELLRDGVFHRVIAKMFGLRLNTVTQINCGHAWKYVTLINI